MTWLARLEIGSEVLCAKNISGDFYTWHKMLWECYPDAPDVKRDFLTRVDQLEGALRFWVLAERKPVRPHWCPPEGFAVKEIAQSFFTHKYYAFDMRVNPVKKKVQRGTNGETLFRPNGKRKGGKRVPLVKPDELRAWLDRKATSGGFTIVDNKPLEIGSMNECFFRKKDKRTGREQSAYHGGVQFRGILEVTDPVKFRDAYCHGIGNAKAFGFGLMLLAPVAL